MAKYEIFLPAMGEGIIEATITKLLKKEGDSIEEEDSIMEIATDKVDSEIPAPVSGVITKILFEEGDVPKVGDIVAIITTDGENIDDSSTSSKTEEASVENKEHEITLAPVAVEESEPMKAKTENGNFISPLVRTIAKAENITNEELNSITGSGEEEVIVTVNSTKESHTLVIEENPGVLSQAEIAKRLKELESLKIHPRELHENTVVINRAARLYRELLGEKRDAVGHCLARFNSALERQDPREIAAARIEFVEALNQIEGEYQF